MNHNELKQQYREAAYKHAAAWRETVSEHIIDIIVSVMMHRDGIINGGGFVTAVCNNDLRGAIGRADDDCKNHLKLIALAYTNASIEQLKYN